MSNDTTQTHGATGEHIIMLPSTPQTLQTADYAWILFVDSCVKEEYPALHTATKLGNNNTFESNLILME